MFDKIMESLGNMTQEYNTETPEGTSGLFAQNTLMNIPNQINQGRMGQINALRTAYGMGEMEPQGMDNLTLNASRIGAAQRAQERANQAKELGEQQSQENPYSDYMMDNINETLKGYRDTNAGLFGR